MPVDAHFLHRCDVLRQAGTHRDSLNANKPDWPIHLSDVRCRWVRKAQRVADTPLAEKPIITSDLLMIPAYTDVREGDKITNIRDERGEVETQGNGTPATYKIEAKLPRRSNSQHHITLQLEKIG